MSSSRNRTPVREPITRPGRELPIGRKLFDSGLGNPRDQEIRGSRRFSTREIQSPPEFAAIGGSMGYDAQCDVRLDGQTVSAQGGARAERSRPAGPVRLSIPLARISEATASDGWLRVRFDGRLAEIGLGPALQKWAQRITNPPSRLAKLGVKAGVRILVARRGRGGVRRGAASRRSDCPAQDGRGRLRRST